MMHDRGKSDSAIVAVKPTNNAGQPAAEPVEPRAGTKRNAGEQSTASPGRRHDISINSISRPHRPNRPCSTPI
jgi:RNA-directed DNA polymerase